ncbi:MAG: MipA/OmpV family protein [Proteobacteria bacterium]|nr:MipA/OmpV family protein [Pseudomonadota bacterium]
MGRRKVGGAAAAIVCLLFAAANAAETAAAESSSAAGPTAGAGPTTAANAVDSGDASGPTRSPTAAESKCDAPSDDCVTVGSWSLSVALGAGVRTNPVVNGRDIPLVVVPQFSYYGKRFFIDNLDPGVTLFDGESNTLSLVASPGYDRVFFYRSDLQNIFAFSPTSFSGGYTSYYAHPPPADLQAQTPSAFRELPRPARKVTYLAGPEWTFKQGSLSGQLDYLHEITGRTHGDEIRGAVGLPLGSLLGGSVNARAGFTWKSAATVNYYYGYPGSYKPGWALNPFVKLGYSRDLSSKWRFDALVHLERLGNAISDSPIVDRHYVTTAFIGATYVFHK